MQTFDRILKEIIEASNEEIRVLTESEVNKFAELVYKKAKSDEKCEDILKQIKKSIEKNVISDDVSASSFIPELEKNVGNIKEFKRILMDWVVALSTA